MTTTAVQATQISPAIRQITLQDKDSRNTFSEALVEGLIKAFEQVNADADCKVVIVTGYDSYFASGGSQQSLLDLQAGKGQFTDINIYSLALDCPVPVIAAMQGHGIGGGFVMGLFSDLVILSRESIYTTNFMKYGFTPGMGATLIVPKKLGTALGHEMLLNAQTYRGEQLQQRGVGFPVYPRDQVLPQALEMATQLAEKPRISLMTLKQHLVAPIVQALPMIVEQELAMHRETLHSQAVKDNIQRLF